jgi:hypothetical protein
MQAVFNALKEPTAEVSLAVMRVRSKFGMAMATITIMMATTTSSSMREKPFSPFRMDSPEGFRLGVGTARPDAHGGGS